MSDPADAAYRSLVAFVACGGKLPAPIVQAVLEASGRSPDALAADLALTQPRRPLRSGDVCPSCGAGRLAVYTSKAVGESQLQRLRCGECGYRVKAILPAGDVRRRSA